MSKISEMLRSLRKREGITQKQLASNTGLSLSAIISYENGLREPNSKAMAALESYFHVSGEYLRGEKKEETLFQATDTVHNPFDETAFTIFKDKMSTAPRELQAEASNCLNVILNFLNDKILTDPTKTKLTSVKLSNLLKVGELDELSIKLIETCLDIELKRQTVVHFNACNDTSQKARIHLLPTQVSEQSASAGTGTYLGVDSFYTVYVDDNKDTRRMKFAVPVSGDSMEPSFYDGDLLMVADEPVEQGDIGIFVLDGEGYVKQLGCNELISLNPEYMPIPLDESIRVSGKVIGVLDPAWIHDNTDF